MESTTFKRARQYFTTSARCSHLILDDGASARWILPWMHFSHARWSYDDPTVLILFIGEWQVHLAGHNLRPLFDAIADHSLSAVQARPDLVPNHPDDSFVTHVRLLRPIAMEVPKPSRGPETQQLGLDLKGSNLQTQS